MPVKFIKVHKHTTTQLLILNHIPSLHIERPHATYALHEGISQSPPAWAVNIG